METKLDYTAPDVKITPFKTSDCADLVSDNIDYWGTEEF